MTVSDDMCRAARDQPDLGDQDYNDVLATWNLQEERFGIGSSTLLDLQADRIPDLAVGSQAGSTSTVLVVATDSGETLLNWQPFGSADLSGVQLASGDVNADGFDDLVAIRQSQPDGQDASLCAQVEVLLGSASPLPSPPSTLSFTAFGAAIDGPLSLAVRDLDLDGYAEVVLSATTADPSRSSLALEVWSAASGSFALSSSPQLPSTGQLDPTHGYAVALGDLDGEGSVELVLGDQQGGALFVGSIAPGGSPGGTLLPATVLQPYGAGFSQGVRPTVISAQQTLVQRPAGLAASALPWALGSTRGSNAALLGGLGTPGALIVQSGDGLDPQPLQLPLSWLSGATTATASAIPLVWDSRSAAPVFASGGVSFLDPGTSETNPTLLQGAPLPILVSAAAGDTSIGLLSGPTASGSGSWSAINASQNSLSSGDQGKQNGWSQPWSTNSNSGIAVTVGRELFNQVSTPLVSYAPPFVIDLNPLALATPEQLISDLAGSSASYLEQVVQPWNSTRLSGSTATAWGPGAPGSGNDPYGSIGVAQLPGFTPSFQPLIAGGDPDAKSVLVKQFQQRLINTAMSSLAINYQHHYSPLWYSPDSWTPNQTPTPQLSYLTTPEGRQTQGLDCSNFSSWNYNLAFGLRLDSAVSAQAQTTSTTVDWLTGAPTLTADVVAEAKNIYRDANNNKRDKDAVIDHLNDILLPGDLLYIAGTPVNTDPGSATPADAKHVITWINNNRARDPLTFVSLNDARADGGKPAFIIDSTGSESFDFQQQYYPNGVQIRQFDEQAWYVENIISIHRWLTPNNVEILAAGLN